MDDRSDGVVRALAMGLRVKNTFLEPDTPTLFPFADALRPNRRSSSCPVRPCLRVQHESYEARQQQQLPAEGEGSAPKKSRGRIAKVMLQNIPNRATQEEVVKAIHDLGFGSLCMSLLIPMAKKGVQNLGYAFVGLANEGVALEFMEAVRSSHYRFPRHPESRKILQASRASRRR